MNIVIIDDEPMAAEDLKETLLAVVPDSAADIFCSCSDALTAAEKKFYDVAFVDISMPEKNGLELAVELKEMNPRTNIVFVTGYSEYAVQAFQINASGYIMKPARKSDVKNALDNLRIKPEQKTKGLRVQCFGQFEVFYDNKKLEFRRSKSKELLAYLVDLQGMAANTDELCRVLFEDNANSAKHYLRNIISEMKHTLKECNCSDVFVYGRNSFAIDTAKLECDYYNLLKGDPYAVNSYMGEYMAQYSWAELTNGMLSFRGQNY